MKNFLCFVVLSALAVSFVAGYPSSRNPLSEESSFEQTVVVPLEAQRAQQNSGEKQGGAGSGAHIIIGGFGPPLDFGSPLVGGFGPQAFNDLPYGYPGLVQDPGFLAGVPQPPAAPSLFSGFNPFAGNPANGGVGFLGGLESGLALMRRQLATLLNNVPGLGFGSPQDGNTTSSTKVIDGHRITINETVYGNGYDGSVFKVRVVDVHPEKSSEETDETTTIGPKGEAEDMGKQIDSSETTTVDNSASEGESENIDNNDDSRESTEKLSNDITEKSDEILESTTKTSIESLDENYKSTTTKRMEANDIIQTIRSEEYTWKPELDSLERFQQDKNFVFSEQARPETWESFEHLNGPEYDDILESNDVQLHDIPEIPVDLTNDIAVNDFLAESGATHNPNSELIEVFGDKVIESEHEELNKRRLRSLRSMTIK